MVELLYNNSFHLSIYMAPYEALYGRRCRFPIGWFEVGECSLVGPNIIYMNFNKFHIIRNRFQTFHSRKRSYANHKRRYLQFEEGDKVYLKNSPMKGVVRFDKKKEVDSSLCVSL